MSKKANPAVIGIFLVGSVVLTVMALFLFGSEKMFSKNEKFILYFASSINGLEEGSAVKFKGVKIGQIVSIRIRYNQPETSAHIPVIIEIDTQRLKNNLGVTVDLSDPTEFADQIRNGLKAKLEFQSYVTGKLYIELDYFPNNRPPFLLQQKFVYKEIPTVQSNLKEIWEAAINTLSQINEINFQGISRHIENIATKLDKGIGEIEFEAINNSIIGAGKSIQAVAQSAELKNAVARFDTAMQSIQKLAQSLENHVDPIAKEVKQSIAQLQTTLERAQGAFNLFYDFSDPEYSLRYNVDNAITEFTEAARSIRLLTDYLERNPKAFLTGKGPSVFDNSNN